MTTKDKKKSAAKVAADKAADELAEVRKINQDQQARARDYGRTVTEITVESDDGDGSITLATAGGKLFVSVDGEVTLGRDGVTSLQAYLDSAFQAV